MARETLKTLFHPFAIGTLSMPSEGERYLFLAAEAGFVPPDGFAATIDTVQGNRAEFLRLEKSGRAPRPAVDGQDYDGALILLGKHKGANEANLAEALSRVRAGGLVVVAGGKDDGVQPLRKRLAGRGLEVEHLPKYHGVVFWFEVPEEAGALVADFAAKPGRVEDRFHTMAGMFSHEQVDDGSELLAGRLPQDFDGNAADFGAGWGYLSVALAERSPRTARIDLFEVDHQALECARRNLSEILPDLSARFFWQDLVSEPAKEKYDLVIMNPPFHQGHATEASLGQAMIRAASAALRSGGRLMLVANRGLPYEPVLAESFREYGETCRNARFKVLWAKK
ncbi:class I SAM-dependent methyltransferase [Rhizobium halophytocola]|uniref:16S rRNA (Guanine1207-N2)-methyltransferase n=1 Tax=Rhizobium halophytocola TaxID=735519 RepID=A0ABS4E127_9HYPH|nr:class I SAM-dependent methyltransferase [Rhizobium halophytocola]MBP1851636.1 16S rRNA (guanine1207-N2)-methyltransferase [Rhizobium halophytocola]